MRTLRFPAAAAFALLTFLAGCGGTGDPGSDPDGAGRLRVAEGPVVRIGSVDDPDYAFGWVEALAEGADGRLYSTHRNQAEVLRWTADGRPDGVIGREGEGPGEFRGPGAVGFFGDSLWVWDRRNARISFFTADAELLGTRSWVIDLSSDPDRPWKSPPRPSRPLRDGSYYGVAPAWSNEIATGELKSALHARLDATGVVTDTLWDQEYRSSDVLALLRDGGGTFMPQPFGDGSQAVLLPDGLAILQRRAWEGEGSPAVTVTKVSFEGDTLFRRAIAYEPVPLPPTRVDSAVGAQADEMYEFIERINPGQAYGALRAQIDEATYRPRYLPYVASMVGTAEGGVWLELTSPTEDGGVEWLALDSAGNMAGRVGTPAGLRILLVERDRFWAVETDELDVNYIVRYDLREAG